MLDDVRALGYRPLLADALMTEFRSFAGSNFLPEAALTPTTASPVGSPVRSMVEGKRTAVIGLSVGGSSTPPAPGTATPLGRDLSSEIHVTEPPGVRVGHGCCGRRGRCSARRVRCQPSFRTRRRTSRAGAAGISSGAASLISLCMPHLSPTRSAVASRPQRAGLPSIWNAFGALKAPFGR
jgi:hypothetical protein